MRLRDSALFTDENVDAEVVRFLRGEGFDVRDVAEEGLLGAADRELLRLAVAEGRVVITHDSDFGTLAIRQGERVVGVLFLRPGHIDPDFTIATLQALLDADPDVEAPFLGVARRRNRSVGVRVRHLE